jgi:hypothetical protein
VSPAAVPPKAKANVCIPQPAIPIRAVFTPVGLDVQLVPFHNSVAVVKVPPFGGAPPLNAKAAVCVPQPPRPCLAVFKLGVLVQLVPLKDSDAAVSPGGNKNPPKDKAAV